MRASHLLLLVLVAAIWGFNFVVAKAGLDEMPPLFLMALRFSVVALLLIWFVPPPRGRWRGVLLLSVTLGSLHFGLMFAGLTGVDASVASIAIQLQVPFAAILAAVFFNDRLGWRRVLGMVLAFAGVVLIAGEPREGASPLHLALVIAASFVWAAGNVQVKALDGLDARTLNAWISLFSAPQLLLLSLLLEHGQLEAAAAATWRGWGAIAYMAVLVTMGAYGIWYAMIDRYPTNQTMPFTLLVPVFGVLSGVLVLDEPFTATMAAGGVLTLLGVGVIVLRRPKLAQPEV
ncbi:MAG: DMT family transporter [Geminicoccales bacterium]